MHARSTALALAILIMGTPVVGQSSAAVRLAPPFAVRSLEGKTFRMADFRGRPVVLDFWATWCAPCRASMPHLDTLQQRFQSEGLVIIGLSVDESGTQAVKRFAQRLGVGFRLAMADDQVLDQYGPIRLLPTTFFINRRGEIVRRVVGQIDPETLETYIRELF